MERNIILIGLMGAGKSTVGRILARRLRWDFCDSDTVIEERTGVTIPMIFEFEGEVGFRDREEKVLADLTQYKNSVLATGGGSILRKKNRQYLQRGGYVVYLRATAKQLYERIKYDKNRPLMQTDDPCKTLNNLLQQREIFYLGIADLIVNTGRQHVSTLVNQIEEKLQQQDIVK